MEHDAKNDAELVAETLAGNHDAFGELYDRHARTVRAVVLGVSRDWSSVEDMAQESFLRACRGLAKLREPERFGPWLIGIARHVARERRRSLRRDRHEFRDSQSCAIESRDDPVAAIDDRDQINLILRTLGDLPEQERLAIHAYFLEQHNARQAEELLGLSRSGFYAVVQRAVARLTALVRSRESKEGTKR